MLFPIFPIVHYRLPIFIEVVLYILRLLLCIPSLVLTPTSSSHWCFSYPSSSSFSPSFRSLFLLSLFSLSYTSSSDPFFPFILSSSLSSYLPIFCSLRFFFSFSVIIPPSPYFVSLSLINFLVLPLSLFFLPHLLSLLFISFSLSFTLFLLLPPSLSSFCESYSSRFSCHSFHWCSSLPSLCLAPFHSSLFGIFLSSEVIITFISIYLQISHHHLLHVHCFHPNFLQNIAYS